MEHTTIAVEFENRGNTVRGDLRIPLDAESSSRRSAIVLVTPGSSRKGQIGRNYATRLSAHGFVTLTFDPSFQGESTGEPRDLEDPAVRIEDVRCAVDFLTTRSEVDADRLGVLGVCAGGGFAVATAKIEHRFKAVGVVAPVNMGRQRRQGGGRDPLGVASALAAVGAQRTAEARGGAVRRDPWIPETPAEAEEAGVTDPDTLDAVDYYGTPRGHDPHRSNRMLATSVALQIGFDAFHLVDELLVQPLQVVVAGRRGSTGQYEDGLLLWEKARTKEPLLVIEGAGHYDLYDEARYVDPAVTRLAAFYAQHLAG
jgi:hypothetical protein